MARCGLSRASVPAACSRAVNFELVRDATAYVCPECGTKCARSVYARERRREGERNPVSRGTRDLFSSANRLFLGSEHIGAIPLVASVGGKCTLRRICTIRFERSSRENHSRSVNPSLARSRCIIRSFVNNSRI